MPDGTRGRDVFCEITASTLKLKLKGQEEFLINGELGKLKPIVCGRLTTERLSL